MRSPRRPILLHRSYQVLNLFGAFCAKNRRDDGGIKRAFPRRVAGDARRLIATHMNDNNGSADQHVCPGYGTVDWLPGMVALGEIGWDGIFNILGESSGNII